MRELDDRLGESINAQNELFLKNTYILNFDSYFRFNDRHSIEGGIFSLRSKGSDSASTSFEFNNDTIKIGAKVESHFEQDIYKINYVYSFHHTNKVEIATLIGLHVTHIDVGIKASGNINDIKDSYSESIFKTTLPLPTAGFKVEYTILDKYLYLDFEASYFWLMFNTFEGSLTTSALSLEYHFVENVGVGISYNTNFMQLKMQNSDKEINIDSRVQGAELYFSYIY